MTFMKNVCGKEDEKRRLPCYHWGIETEMEMVGAMVAHSILQRGPGFKCIHPALKVCY